MQAWVLLRLLQTVLLIVTTLPHGGLLIKTIDIVLDVLLALPQLLSHFGSKRGLANGVLR